MALLPAPHADYLRHDAGEIRIHDAGIQSSRGAPGNDIDDPDMEPSHGKSGAIISSSLLRGPKYDRASSHKKPLKPSNHRCQRIRASSKGTATPECCGITRTV